MPRVVGYTPAWLGEPQTPGHAVFAAPDESARASSFSSYSKKRKTEPGPRRTIARRGTEIFVANGRELKWADLVYLKDSYEAKNSRFIKREDSVGPSADYSDFTAPGYRTIKTPVADEIKQLVISPQEDYLAVLTSHTVHICVLPDSSHLSTEDPATLKPRYFSLGPTAHVTSRAPIASALWHPLGAHGSALVTVTKDAVVRVWEVSASDRWSFDKPTLAIDLKKLADGTSLDQDFTASTASTNKTFSPDSFDMEVAAACFGDRASGGWSPMTLWLAMRGGDVYALCPLLPQRWSPPATLIPSLSVSIVAKVAGQEVDSAAPPVEKLLAQQQLDWMADLDNQEPRVVESTVGEIPSEIYARPSHPGIIPRLQGPFEFDLDLESDFDQDNELCDVFVIGERAEVDELMRGEEELLDGVDREGLSLSIICLISTSGKLRICLDMDGVEAQWLPSRKQSKIARLTEELEAPSLTTFQALDVLRERERREDSWSTISPDVTSRYAFFVTHPFGITYISLSPWVFRLEGELNAAELEGQDFRLKLLVGGQSSIRERLYTHQHEGTLAACNVMQDPDLGYFLVSATNTRAVALSLETPEDDLRSPVRAVRSPTYEHEPAQGPQQQPEFYVSRPTFQEPEGLSARSELDQARAMLFTSRHQFLKNQEVRLSPATLEILSNAHRLVGVETVRLNRAAAEMFTQLQNLPAELEEQISKAKFLKERIEKISGQDMDDQQPISDRERLTRRLKDANARQQELTARLDRLKKVTSKATGRDLSDKEHGWMKEVSTMQNSIMASQKGDRAGVVRQPWQRFDEIKSLKDELVTQANRLLEANGEANNGENFTQSVNSLKIPSEVRRAKLSQVNTLLDRETAMVEAMKTRLERLAVG